MHSRATFCLPTVIIVASGMMLLRDLEIKRWDYGVCEKIRKLRQVEIDRDFGD